MEPSAAWTWKVSWVQLCGAGQVTKVDPPQPQTSRPQGLPVPKKPEVQGTPGSLVATSNVRMHAPCLFGLWGSIRRLFAADSGMWMPFEVVTGHPDIAAAMSAVLVPRGEA